MSQDKVYTLLERLELDLNFSKDIILKELNSLGVFDPSEDWKILDRGIAGGQIVKWCEDSFLENNICPIGRVYGCEKRKITVQLAIVTNKLKGNYIHTGDYMIEPRFDNISFLPGERNFKYIEIGNYPYNDGSINNNVIWNKFISDVRKSRADAVGVVVQASFLSQAYSGMSKSVKDDLIALGCYKIVVNDYSDFPEDKAKVKTCIIFCRRGYQGLVEFVERKTGLSVKTVLDAPFNMIFNPGHIKFLSEIDLARKKSFNRFPQYKKWTADSASNKELWAIGSYYKTEGFDKNPLKQFVLIPPNSGKEKDYYCVFGSAKSEADAVTLREQLNSFWFNDAVQAVLMLTRYQISLDKTQYAKVPKTDIVSVFSEDDLFDLWGITPESKDIAKELVKDCNHKKIKEKTDDSENN